MPWPISDADPDADPVPPMETNDQQPTTKNARLRRASGLKMLFMGGSLAACLFALTTSSGPVEYAERPDLIVDDTPIQAAPERVLPAAEEAARRMGMEVRPFDDDAAFRFRYRLPPQWKGQPALYVAGYLVRSEGSTLEIWGWPAWTKKTPEGRWRAGFGLLPHLISQATKQVADPTSVSPFSRAFEPLDASSDLVLRDLFLPATAAPLVAQPALPGYEEAIRDRFRYRLDVDWFGAGCLVIGAAGLASYYGFAARLGVSRSPWASVWYGAGVGFVLGGLGLLVWNRFMSLTGDLRWIRFNNAVAASGFRFEGGGPGAAGP